MIEIDKLKKIVVRWAEEEVKSNCRIYLFGSQAKGTANPDSDVNIAIEFSELKLESEKTLLWRDKHSEWGEYLSSTLEKKVHLELFEGKRSKRLAKALQNCSIVLYASEVLLVAMWEEHLSQVLVGHYTEAEQNKMADLYAKLVTGGMIQEVTPFQLEEEDF